MKTLLLIFLKILYVSTLELNNTCDYQNGTLPFNRSDENNEISVNMDFLCSLRCYMQEKILINENNTSCTLNIPYFNSVDYTIDDENKNIFNVVAVPKDNFKSSDLYVTLKEKETLDYKKTDRYMFYIKIENGTVFGAIIVDIKVFQLPFWVNLPSITKIDEESTRNFSIVASPGGGCNDSEIRYSLNDTSGFSKINETTGVMNIGPIDRDGGEKRGHIIVLVDDIDDHPPKMNPNGSVTIRLSKIAVSSYRIEVTDPDLGYNSAFSVVLAKPQTISDAININSTRGSGNTSLELQIDPRKIDFSDGFWNSFYINAKVESLSTPNFGDSLSVKIEFFEDNTSGSINCINTSVLTVVIFLICSFVIVM